MWIFSFDLPYTFFPTTTKLYNFPVLKQVLRTPERTLLKTSRVAYQDNDKRNTELFGLRDEWECYSVEGFSKIEKDVKGTS